MKMIVDYLINIYKKYGTLFQGKLFNTFILFYKHKRISSMAESLKFAMKALLKVKVYKHKEKVIAIKKMLSEVEFDIEGSNIFVYSIDIYKNLKLRGRILGNCCIDYKKIVSRSLDDAFMEGESEFVRNNNRLLEEIYQYLERLIEVVRESNHNNKEKICEYISRMKYCKAESLEEALQRILIINQIQWQFGHILVGLGRLDYVLDEFTDKNEYDEQILLIEEFCRMLHKYYFVKSNALMGDTGQIIILGGLNLDGTYFCNRLTKVFVDAVANIQLPDPKVLIRVSKVMPNEMWQMVAKTMTTVAGSPLISNDDQVIEKLIDFGYEAKDAYNYTTSACWEPVVGESFEQNNILSINYLEPFNIISKEYELNSITTFDELLERYFEALEKHINEITSYLSTLRWETDPLYSMFCEKARKNQEDVAIGGSGYNNYGVLTVGLANAINSLFNLKSIVFEQHQYSYAQIDSLRRKNFAKDVVLENTLKNSKKYYGKDDDSVIELVQKITNKTEDIIRKYTNPYGGHVKFGLSSPHYIMNSTNFPASFDGRKSKEPFSIHISAEGGVAYTELFNFASRLDYSGFKFNGNVVDFMVSPNFVKNNFYKFSELIKLGIENGIYQMQANVIDSSVLIAAKEDPNAYSNLIVRVWGFNAYFKELPVEYQDYLIERALQSETAA